MNIYLIYLIYLYSLYILNIAIQAIGIWGDNSKWWFEVVKKLFLKLWHILQLKDDLTKPLFLTQDTAMSKLWFKQDDKFFLPKACLNFEFFRYAMLSISHKIISKSFLFIGNLHLCSKRFLALQSLCPYFEYEIRLRCRKAHLRYAVIE